MTVIILATLILVFFSRLEISRLHRKLDALRLNLIPEDSYKEPSHFDRQRLRWRREK